VNIKKLPVGSITPNDWNPNRMDDRVFHSLRAGMEKLGYLQPVVVREVGEGAYEIIDGEHRWRAAQEDGKKQIECVIVDLTDEEAMTATLALNNVRGEADPIALAEVVVDLLRRDMSLEELVELTALDELAVRDMVELIDGEPEEPGDPIGEAPVEVSILLMPDQHAGFEAAMEKAVGMCAKAGTIILIGDQVAKYDAAMRKGMDLAATTNRGRALETICEEFLSGE